MTVDHDLDYHHRSRACSSSDWGCAELVSSIFAHAKLPISTGDQEKLTVKRVRHAETGFQKQRKKERKKQRCAAVSLTDLWVLTVDQPQLCICFLNKNGRCFARDYFLFSVVCPTAVLVQWDLPLTLSHHGTELVCSAPCCFPVSPPLSLQALLLSCVSSLGNYLPPKTWGPKGNTDNTEVILCYSPNLRRAFVCFFHFFFIWPQYEQTGMINATNDRISRHGCRTGVAGAVKSAYKEKDMVTADLHWWRTERWAWRWPVPGQDSLWGWGGPAVTHANTDNTHTSTDISITATQTAGLVFEVEAVRSVGAMIVWIYLNGRRIAYLSTKLLFHVRWQDLLSSST